MKISELSRRTGVSVHRLRRYEADGLLRAVRSRAGWREFDERSVREVVFIGMGREIGLSLKLLAQALPRYRTGRLTVAEMIDTLQHRIAEIDTLVAEQQALRARLVDHITWFHRRQAASAAATAPGGFPASPPPAKRAAPARRPRPPGRAPLPRPKPP